MTSCVMELRLRTDLTSQLGILKAHPILTTSGIRLSGLTSEGRKVQVVPWCGAPNRCW